MTRDRGRARIAVEASLPRFRGAARRVREIVSTSLPRLVKHPLSVEFFLISDREMRSLNLRTRGKDRPTNVLSFEEGEKMPHPELPHGTEAKGEVYLAPDYIVRHGERLEPLALHGLLHLLGYTHRGARDRMRMERKEKELLRSVKG